MKQKTKAGFVPTLKHRAPLVDAIWNIQNRIYALQELLAEIKESNPKNYWSRYDLVEIDHAIRMYTDAKTRKKRGWYDPK